MAEGEKDGSAWGRPRAIMGDVCTHRGASKAKGDGPRRLVLPFKLLRARVQWIRKREPLVQGSFQDSGCKMYANKKATYKFYLVSG
ncbi:hypothetical protein TH63_15430 [Rufibacter radiotolerans]|uniref:Uncharacterized protein n=1 Tax=Rufibacter radiotolerans TaxID=1379910 RepID=A0A0H4VRX2_9BACT|nr:hypothetical protein TH63_15430 [Rufibacter radiotolerans]